MTEVYLMRRYDGSIGGVSAEDREKLKRFKVGNTFKACVTKPRNLKFHRKFFGLINVVFANQDAFNDAEKLRHWLLLKAGVVDWIMGPDGIGYPCPKSLQFAKMDDIEFHEIYKKVLNTVWEYLIPLRTQKDRDAFEQEILSYE